MIPYTQDDRNVILLFYLRHLVGQVRYRSVALLLD